MDKRAAASERARKQGQPARVFGNQWTLSSAASVSTSSRLHVCRGWVALRLRAPGAPALRIDVMTIAPCAMKIAGAASLLLAVVAFFSTLGRCQCIMMAESLLVKRVDTEL